MLFKNAVLVSGFHFGMCNTVVYYVKHSYPYTFWSRIESRKYVQILKKYIR